MNPITKTILGIPLALIVWAVVYLLAYAGLTLLDMTRGLSDNWLQSIFREWFTPAVGGFAAIHAVNKVLDGANLKWVAIVFCAPLVLLYIGFSLYLIVTYGDKLEYSLGEQITQWGMAIATCIGSFIAVNGLKNDS